MNTTLPKRRYLGLSLLLVLSLACSAVNSLLNPTEVPPPTRTPRPKATATAKPRPTQTKIPTRTARPSYNGNWTGTTSQGEPIFLTIRGNQVEVIVTAIEMRGSGCTSKFSGTLTSTFVAAEKAFQANTTDTGGSVTVYGLFDSADSVSGNIIYVHTGNCTGAVQIEWSATKDAS